MGREHRRDGTGTQPSQMPAARAASPFAAASLADAPVTDEERRRLLPSPLPDDKLAVGLEGPDTGGSGRGPGCWQGGPSRCR